MTIPLHAHFLDRPSARLKGWVLSTFLAASLLAMPQAASAQDADRAAIEDVMVRYRTAVSSGDEPLFLTTLLSTDIPFYAVGNGAPASETDVVAALRGVDGFRQRVFHGVLDLDQTFEEIRIEREGDLAQVSLRFVTRVLGSDQGEGWKTLVLLRTAGGWKIASELHTVRALAAPADGR